MITMASDTIETMSFDYQRVNDFLYRMMWVRDRELNSITNGIRPYTSQQADSNLLVSQQGLENLTDNL